MSQNNKISDMGENPIKVAFDEKNNLKCWAALTSRINLIDLKLPPEAGILLTLQDPSRDRIVGLRDSLSYLPLCFDKPIFAQDYSAQKRQPYFSVGVISASDIEGGFVYPQEVEHSRYRRILSDQGIDPQPMRRELAPGKFILYVMGARSSKSSEYDSFSYAIKCLRMLYLRTGRQVVVVVPLCRVPENNDLDAIKPFVEMADLIHELGYALVTNGQILRSLYPDCAAIVTSCSVSGIDALLAGIPVINRDPRSFVSPICASSFDSVEDGSVIIEDSVRDAWLSRLAFTQWSESEIEDGRMLHHYLPEIRRHLKHFETRRLSSWPVYLPKLHSSGSAKTIEISKRALGIDPTWQNERKMQEWYYGSGDDSGISTRVWALSHVVDENDCVLVAGAGIGFSSLVAIGAGAAEVIAFEPDPRHTNRLTELAGNGIQVIPVALGENSGEAFLHLSTRESHSSWVVPEGRKCGDGEPEGSVRVPKRRLDQLCTDFEFDVMFIDVLGSSPAVLQGASGVLARRKPRAVIVVGGENEIRQVTDTLKNLYERCARVEAGDEGWCRLLDRNVSDCGHSYPHTFAFYDLPLFPNDGNWSPPAAPRAVPGVPPEWIDTSVVTKEVPIGRFGLLDR